MSLLCFAFLTSCGDDLPKKKSTPEEKKPNSPSQPQPSTPQDPKKLPPAANLFLPAEAVMSVNKKFTAKIEWLKPQSVSSNNEVKIIFATLDFKKPGTLEKLSLKPWMVEMNHGCGKDCDPAFFSTDANPHVVYVKKIKFTMSGKWTLQVEALIDGQVDSINFETEVP